MGKSGDLTSRLPRPNKTDNSPARLALVSHGSTINLNLNQNQNHLPARSRFSHGSTINLSLSQNH